MLRRTGFRRATLNEADLRGSDLGGVALGSPDRAGVTVDGHQLLALARFLGVTVADAVSGESAQD